MGWLSDFVKNPVGRITKDVKDVGKVVYETQKDVIGAARDHVDHTLANIDDVGKEIGKMAGDVVQYAGDTIGNTLSDPTDINSYTDPAEEWLDDFNQSGENLFGTGGWIKAGTNTLTSGNPFMGLGTTIYRGGDDQYSDGQLGGVGGLTGLYNTPLGEVEDFIGDGLRKVTDSVSDSVQDVIDFERVNLKNIGRTITKSPERLLLGLPFDELGTDVTNKIFGTDYDAAVNRWGGPTEETYMDAARQGVDVRASAYTNALAQMIAGSYAGNWASGVAGGYFNGGTGANATASGGAGMNYNLTDNPELTGAYDFSNIGFDGGSTNVPQVNPAQVGMQYSNMYPETSTLGGYMDSAKDFLNSNTGKVAKTGLSMVNPTLGNLVNSAGSALNGNMGKAAFDTLASLYMENKNRKSQKAYQNQMNQQIQSLNSMYSPNSAYAQQLRKELERKDAASGRRSQYGPREVELQARLADKQSGLAPMTNMLTSQAYQNTLKEEQASRSRQIAQLMQLFTPEKGSTNPMNSTGGKAAMQGWDAIKSIWSSL